MKFVFGSAIKRKYNLNISVEFLFIQNLIHFVTKYI